MKLRTFPSPHPDELLYSLAARYQVRISPQSSRNVLKSFFGSERVCAIFDLPCHLDVLSGRLPETSIFTTDYLIDKHTLLGFYEPFLSPERVERVRLMMAGSDSGGSIHQVVGILGSGIRMISRLKYCPECLKSDREEVWEGYWHRSHQVQGIRVCHRHHVPLLESSVQILNRDNKHIFQALERVASSDDKRLIPIRNIRSIDIWLAENTNWLLNNRPPFFGTSVLRERYIDLLENKGLITSGGSVRQERLMKEFMDYYGRQYLEEIGYDFDPDNHNNWLKVLLRRYQRVVHPIRHLLLMKFLDTGPEKFLTDHVSKQRPFGEPPYPCLNPVAEHFRELVVDKMMLGRNRAKGAPVGKFYCSCGFAYTRKGPDKVEADRFKRSRIISVGPIWENELLKLVSDPRMKMKQIAKQLGIDVKGLERHLERIRRQERGRLSQNGK